MRQGAGRYIPQLDGLRGIAVLMVVAYHIPVVGSSHLVSLICGLIYQLRLGAVGVDIFFVMSGFLITGVLLQSRNAPRTAASMQFYAKRALRIFPIYFLCLSYCIVFQSLSRQESWFSGFFLENYHLIGTHGLSTSFSHTWSLSIEEQFYLAWPWLVWFLPLASGRLATGFLVPAISIAIAFAIVNLMNQPDGQWAIFEASPVRMLSLSLGGYLAYRAIENKPLDGKYAALWMLGGVAILAGAKLAQSRIGIGNYYHMLGVPGFALMSFGLVAAALAPRGRNVTALRRALSVAPLRSVGAVSYGLYLYHYIVFWSFGMIFETGGARSVSPARLIAALLLTVVITVASYHFIEQPFLRLKGYLRVPGPRTQATATSLAST